MKSLVSSLKNALLFLCLFLSLWIKGSSLSAKDFEIYDLELNTADFSVEASKWQVSSANSLGAIYTNCGGTYLMGGYEVTWTSTTSFKRTYTSLQAHNTLFISIDFYLLGSWDVFDTITITASTGSTVAFTKTLNPIVPPATWTDTACTDSTLGTKMPVTIFNQVPHTADNLTLEVACQSLYIPGQGLAYCGFKNIRILLTTQTKTASTGAITKATLTNVLPAISTGCAVGEYKDTTTGICTSCDGTCENCIDQLVTSCLSCKGDRIYDGTKCAGCDSTCLTCSGLGASNCLSCNTGDFLHNNGTCSNTCNSPYKEVTTNGIKYCEFPCSSDLYFYPDGSCTAQCSSPMLKEETSDGKYCHDPCKDTSLYYYSSEGYCRTVCEEPFVATFVNFYKICELPKKAVAIDYVISVTGGIASSGLMVTSLLSVGDPMAILIGTMSMMIHYVKYLNISYSSDLEKRFSLQDSSSIAIDFWLERSDLDENDFEESPVPYVFKKNRLLPSFLENFLPTFIVMMVVTGIFLIFKGLEWYFKKYHKGSNLIALLHNKKIAVQNFLTIIFYLSYPIVIFFSIIDFKSVRERNNLDALSACMFIVLIVIGFKVFWVHFMTVKKQQNLMDQGLIITLDDLGNFYKKNETVLVVFQDFRDYTFASQIYLLVFMARALLFTLVVSLLNQHPLVQSVLIILLNFLMIVYLIYKDPLRHRFQLLHQLVYEVILLLINVSVAAMAYFDSQDWDVVGPRDGLSGFIIAMTVLFNLLAMLYVGTVAFNFFKTLSKTKRVKRVGSITSNSSDEANTNSSQIIRDNCIGQKPKSVLGPSRITEHIVRGQNFRPMHLAAASGDQLSFRGEAIQPPSYAQASMIQDESRMTENSFIKERSFIENITEQGNEAKMERGDSYDLPSFANQEAYQVGGTYMSNVSLRFGLRGTVASQPMEYSRALRRDKTGPKRGPSIRPTRISDNTGLQGLDGFNDH